MATMVLSRLKKILKNKLIIKVLWYLLVIIIIFFLILMVRTFLKYGLKPQDITSILQTFVTGIMLLIAITQIKLLSKQIAVMYKQIDHQTEWQIKDSTFKYLDQYTTSLREINLDLQRKMECLNQRGIQINFETMKEYIKDDLITRDQLYQLTAYFEQLAFGIEIGYFNEMIVRNIIYNSVMASSQFLLPYFLVRREEMKNENIGIYFENLIREWKELS